MRNGLNITGVSETVHELRDHPEEAIADFAVAAPVEAAPADGTIRTKALTLRSGTIRVARDFRLTQGELGAAPPYLADRAPTPYESALAALGSCVLITKVNGYTARGVTLGSLRVTVTAGLALDAAGRPAAGAALGDLAWHCELDCDAPMDTVESLNRLVTAFSPNHRVFLDESAIELVATVRRPDGGSTEVTVPWEPQDAPAASVAAVRAEVVWENGSEATYRTELTVDGVRHASGPLVVDQAKQMLGIDKGPNSQEILLSALCGELTTLVREETHGLGLSDVRLWAGGRLDTRGMLNVDRDISSSFHNLRVRLSARGDAPADELRAALGRAMSRATVPATLRRSGPVDVRLTRPDGAGFSCRSTTAQAEEVRDDVTRRQRAAA
ncbi:OsmC family protein [Streptomyces sp. NPDC002935]|uniref:OsmC family protein n=1 Tax=Streptomyces sp. NPDC002935 TaxID=3154545 RepID=UPI0033AE2EB8